MSDLYDSHLESLSPAQRSAYQSAWLRDLVAHAYAHAPAVRRNFEAANLSPDDISSLESLPRVPIFRKDDLLDLQRSEPPFGGFLTVPPEQLPRAFMSPGPLFDPQGPEPDYWRFAPALHAAGFRRHDVVLNACAYQMTPLGMMFDDAARHLGCSVIPSGTGNTESQVTIARGLRATAYCGTPSFLKIILDKAIEMGLDLERDLAIRHAFVAAEMLPESLRAEIEALGVTVRQGYGTADLGCLGFECSALGGMHVPEDAIVEIVDPSTGQPVPTGQPGEVVATVNRSTYALLRFGTGDLSSLTDEPCQCGRTSPKLTRIMGRIGDAVKVRGMFVHPRRLADIVARFPEIERFEALVTRDDNRDELTVRIQSSRELPTGLADRLADELRGVIHLRAQIEIVPSGTIPADAKPLVDQRTWD